RLRHENECLRRELEERAKQVADQRREIEDLKRQLALRQQNSTITSKPPSSDGLAGRQRVRGRRVKSRRRPGGQPGHPGHARAWVRAGGWLVVLIIFPVGSRRCAPRLHACVPGGAPRRQKKPAPPPMAAHITEHRCHGRQCPDCGTITVAPIPKKSSASS